MSFLYVDLGRVSVQADDFNKRTKGRARSVKVSGGSAERLIGCFSKTLSA